LSLLARQSLKNHRRHRRLYSLSPQLAELM
jgi:hypothetical protein